MPQFVTVAKIGELAAGESVSFAGPNQKMIGLFRDGDEYFAIDDMCPHAGAPLTGGYVENGMVTCRWHAWRFRLSDGAWADNPRIKIGCYPVRIVGDEIQVELPDPTSEKSA